MESISIATTDELPRRRRRIAGALLGGLLLAGLLPVAPARAGIDPLYEPPPEPPAWLVEWLDEWRAVGALTPELLQMRGEDPVRAALEHAATEGSGVERWRPLVEVYFQPGDVGWALRIIRCESGGNPQAKNPRSTASGLFQHLASLWPDRAAKAGFAAQSVFDPEANVAVAAWLLYEGGGKSHWVCRG